VRDGSELAAVREPSGSGGGGSEGVFVVVALGSRVVATGIDARIWSGGSG
jgi:hypothetical protein